MRKRILYILVLWLLLFLVAFLLYWFREGQAVTTLLDWVTTSGVAWLYGGLFVVGTALTGVIWRTIGRNKAEARQAGLSNRDALFKAIGIFQSAAQTLIERERDLRFLQEMRPNDFHTEAINKRDDAHTEYVKARKELDNEKLVAGELFNPPVMDYITLVVAELEKGVELRPGDLAFHAYAQTGAQAAINKLDQIANGIRKG